VIRTAGLAADTAPAPSPHAPAATPREIARLLGPADEVSAIDNGTQVEIQLGHFCNNRCVFCASGQLTERGLAMPVPARKVEAALAEAAVRGIRKVTFLGGEPTIQDAFLPSLRRAIALGFDDVTIFTNGARTGDPRFVDTVCGLGRFTWRISLQGATETAHDAAVGHLGAFRKIVNGLLLLRARGQVVTANMCLTSLALPSLPALPSLLLDHGVQQMCIDMVRPVSAGDRSDAWLARILPRFPDAGRALRGVVQEFDRRAPGYDLNLTHLPFCALPEFAQRIHHGGEATVTFTADLDERQGVMDKYAFQRSDRTLLPECMGCVFRPRCTGVPKAYARLFGSGDVRAIGLVELRRLDPRQRSFVDHVGAQIAALRRVHVPEPWRRTELRVDAHGRMVVAHFRYAGSTECALRLVSGCDPVPAGMVQLAATARWRLVTAPRFEVPRPVLAMLVRAVAGTLVQRPSTTMTHTS
jgi:MoaA/NifB/PqqE/SkfB family radical SAM enzyme